METHISSLVFEGDLVHKRKKPVRFAFIDLSTPKQRELMCVARNLPSPRCGGRPPGLKRVRPDPPGDRAELSSYGIGRSVASGGYEPATQGVRSSQSTQSTPAAFT